MNSAMLAMVMRGGEGCGGRGQGVRLRDSGALDHGGGGGDVVVVVLLLLLLLLLCGRRDCRRIIMKTTDI